MHIFFSVGEPSGDLHAARLVQELRSRVPRLKCSALGGPQMEAAGCELLFPLTKLAVMGIFDVLPLIWKFIQLLRQTGRFLDEQRPIAVVLVDFPGFNWWVARLAKRRGIPVLYYLPPQLWAWAPWRIAKMRRFVDQVLCCLPFEHAWYRERGVPVRYVGHPFFDEAAERPIDREFIQSTRAAAAGRQIVGVLPGSRNKEIEWNFGVQLEVMQELVRRRPNLVFHVACYREAHRTRCREWLDQSGLSLPVEFHVGRTAEIIELSEACLMVSGSVSLELLARGTPAVVLYRVGWLNGLLGRLLVTCRFITLTNLIAGRELIPEFVITGGTAEPIQKMADRLHDWLSSPQAQGTVRGDLRRLSEEVAVPGATRHAADAILEMLTGRAAGPQVAARSAAA